jgi:hypothetical protein
MKLLGFFAMSRYTKVRDRATGQLCSDFPENANYMFLKITIKLSDKHRVTIETCIECHKMKT